VISRRFPVAAATGHHVTGEFFEPQGHQTGPPYEVGQGNGSADVRKTPEERRERDFQFASRQRGPETEVRSVLERQMRVRTAADVELRGVSEDPSSRLAEVMEIWTASPFRISTSPSRTSSVATCNRMMSMTGCNYSSRGLPSRQKQPPEPDSPP
jgi:hypothetical protein